MLTNKQTFILSIVVVLGFIISGIFNVLDNFVVISFLILCFMAIIINLFLNKDFLDDNIEEPEE